LLLSNLDDCCPKLVPKRAIGDFIAELLLELTEVENGATDGGVLNVADGV
jgi:hypothetical protein